VIVRTDIAAYRSSRGLPIKAMCRTFYLFDGETSSNKPNLEAISRNSLHSASVKAHRLISCSASYPSKSFIV